MAAAGDIYTGLSPWRNAIGGWIGDSAENVFVRPSSSLLLRPLCQKS